MPVKLIAAPVTTAVSRDEAKLHCRIDDNDSDNLIDVYIKAATAHIEAYYGLLVEQTWELVLDEFPCDEIQVPLFPLISVVSVKYDDADGDEQTVDVADYTVDAVSRPGWVLPADSWPSTFDGVNAVRIRFTAGYPVIPASGDTPAQVTTPSDIKAAMLLLIGHWYENREAVVIGQTVAQLPMAVDALLAPYRIWSI